MLVLRFLFSVYLACNTNLLCLFQFFNLVSWREQCSAMCFLHLIKCIEISPKERQNLKKKKELNLKELQVSLRREFVKGRLLSINYHSQRQSGGPITTYNYQF